VPAIFADADHHAYLRRRNDDRSRARRPGIDAVQARYGEQYKPTERHHFELSLKVISWLVVWRVPAQSKFSVRQEMASVLHRAERESAVTGNL